VTSSVTKNILFNTLNANYEKRSNLNYNSLYKKWKKYKSHWLRLPIDLCAAYLVS